MKKINYLLIVVYFQKKISDYEFSAIDIFIDYFCGSTLNYPIIWGQLIGNSKNKNLWKARSDSEETGQTEVEAQL
jgi:hypothetical protein